MTTTNEKKTKVISARIPPAVSQEIDIISKNTGISRAKVVLAALRVFFSDPKRKKILSPIEMRLDEIEERLSDIEHRLKMPDGQQ
ncbi:MAG TPA: hypothetical protein DDW27_11975 [Bacteroidales bacterium]|nr:hypothetical protein [Bacteroidales bacterium]